ncbi:MAG: T9SS type A sorting domain-containing protein, partial [Bacteroidota bacterium]
PTDCPQAEVTWYHDGVVIGSTMTTSSPFTYQPPDGASVSGNYYAVASNPCCDEAVATEVVTLQPLPTVAIAGPCFICNSNADTLYALVSHAQLSEVTLQWYVDGDELPGAIGPFLEIFDHTGDTYELKMTDVNGCMSTATFTPYERCFLVSVREAPYLDARIFPNPVRNLLWVELPHAETFTTLTLYTGDGRPVKVFSVAPAQSNFQLVIAELPAGAYILQGITDSGKRMVEEVIIQ